MQRLVKEYLSEWKKQQRKRRRIGIAVMLLIVMVVGGVIGSLTQYGVALTGTPRCGIEEHTHDASCYTSAVTCGQEEDGGHQHTEACYTESTELTCGQEEGEEHQHGDGCYTTSSELTCGQEESAGHTHTDACYTEELTCGMEEHTHTDDCYIDTNADVEDASVWNEQYKDVEWKETWGENLVIAAQMQIGYKESSVNYIVSEDGSRKGYTRYGQFATNAEANAEDNPEGNTAGDAYRDWDAAFVNFCMYYAGLTSIEPKVFPEDLKAADTTTWCEEFGKIREENGNYLAAPEDHTPVPGDLVFSVRENEEREGQMGIVSSYNKETNEIKVIEGNSQNEVRENTYDANDEKIVSYLMMSEIEKDYKGNGDDAADEEDPGQDDADAEENPGQDDANVEETPKQDEVKEPEENQDSKKDQTLEEDKNAGDTKEPEKTDEGDKEETESEDRTDYSDSMTLEDLKNLPEDEVGSAIWMGETAKAQKSKMRRAAERNTDTWSCDAYYVGQNDNHYVEKNTDFNLKYQMEFHTNRNFSKNQISIKIKRALLEDRDNNPINPNQIAVSEVQKDDNGVEIPVEKDNMPFNYRIIEENGEEYLEFFNYRAIDAGTNIAWQILYKNLKIMQIEDEKEWKLEPTITIWQMENSENGIIAKDSEGRNVVEEERYTDPMEGKVNSSVEITRLTKKKYKEYNKSYTPCLYTASQVNRYIGYISEDNKAKFFEKDEKGNQVLRSEDWRFVVWQITMEGKATQPWQVNIQEMVGEKGEVVGYKDYSNKAQGYDFPIDPKKALEEGVLIGENQRGSWSSRFYVVTAHPYDNSATEMLSLGAGDDDNNTLTNNVVVSAIAKDGKDYPSRKQAQAELVYEDFEWRYSGNVIGINKENGYFDDEPYAGWLEVYDRLNKSENKRDYGDIPFTSIGELQGYQYTHYTSGPEIGQYIEGTSFKLTTADDMMCVNTKDGTSRILGASDYYYTKVSVTQRDFGYDIWEDEEKSTIEKNDEMIDQDVEIYAMYENSQGWELVEKIPWNSSGKMKYEFGSELDRKPWRVKAEHVSTNYRTTCEIKVNVCIKKDSPVMKDFLTNYKQGNLDSIEFEDLSGVIGQYRKSKEGSLILIANKRDGENNISSESTVNYDGRQELKEATQELYKDVLSKDYLNDVWEFPMYRDNACKEVTGLQKSAESWKEVTDSSNDVANNRGQIVYSLTAHDGYQVFNEEALTELKRTGLESPGRNKVAFYDLLPYGMEFDPSYQVTAGRIKDLDPYYRYAKQPSLWDRSQVEVTWETKENHNGTGRTLVIFHIVYDGTDSAVYSNQKWLEGWGVSFRAYYDWKDAEIVKKDANISAFMTDLQDAHYKDPLLGTDDQVAKDNGKDPSGNEFGSESSIFGKEYADFGSDIDGNSGNNDIRSILYASNDSVDEIVQSFQADIKKRVRADQRDDQDNHTQFRGSASVEEGGFYTYEITVSTAAMALDNIIIYDHLENAEADRTTENGGDKDPNYNGFADSAEEKGTLQSVITSGLEKMDINAVVYYSDKPDAVMDLGESDIWYTEEKFRETHDDSLEAARSIAVDLRTKKDGSPFSLESNKALSFKIKMKAPQLLDDAAEGQAHYMYNAPAYKSKSGGIENSILWGNSTKVRVEKAKDLIVEKKFQEGREIPDAVKNNLFQFQLSDTEGNSPFNYEGYILQKKNENGEWENQKGQYATDQYGYMNLHADERAVFKQVPNVSRIKVEETENIFWKSDTKESDTKENRIVTVENMYRPVLYVQKETDGIPDSVQTDSAEFTFQVTTGEDVPLAEVDYYYVDRVRTNGGIPEIVKDKGENGKGKTDAKGKFTIKKGDIIALFPGNVGTKYKVKEIMTSEIEDDWICRTDAVEGTVSVKGDSVVIKNSYLWKDLYLTKAITHQDPEECSETFTFEIKKIVDGKEISFATWPEEEKSKITLSLWQQTEDGYEQIKNVNGLSVDTNGRFEYKCAGKTIRISGLKANETYRIKEIVDPNSDYLPNEDTVEVKMSIGSGQKEATITNDYQYRPLLISKKVVGGKLLNNDEFTMQVKIDGKLLDKDTNYTLLEDGVPDKQEKVSDEGRIGLKTGQTAVFKDITKLGQKYEVTEIKHNGYKQVFPADDKPHTGNISGEEVKLEFINADESAGKNLYIQKEYVASEMDRPAAELRDSIKNSISGGESTERKYWATVSLSVNGKAFKGGKITGINQLTGEIIELEPTGTSKYFPAWNYDSYGLVPWYLIIISEDTLRKGAGILASETELYYSLSEQPGSQHRIEKIGSHYLQIDQKEPENDKSVEGTLKDQPFALIKNEIKSRDITGRITKEMAKGSEAVTPGANLIWRVERYNGLSWQPAEGISYMPLLGFWDMDPNSYESMPGDMKIQSTGTDGIIQLQKPNGSWIQGKEAWPGVEFVDDNVKINVKNPQLGDLRVVEVLNESDEEWGSLSAYKAITTEESGIKTAQKGLNLYDIQDGGFINSNKKSTVEISKQLQNGEDKGDTFTMILKQVLSTDENGKIVSAEGRSGIPYILHDSKGGVREEITGEGGEILLKAGEYASVELPEGTQWTVSENIDHTYSLVNLEPEEETDTFKKLDPNLMLIRPEQETDQSYCVTYYDRGSIYSTDTILEGDSHVIKFCTNTRDGYEFIGWSYTNISTTADVFAGDSYQYSGDVNLYAVWEKKKVTLRYMLDDKEFREEKYHQGTNVTVKSFSELANEDDYCKEGYTTKFLGWVTNPEFADREDHRWNPGNLMFLSGYDSRILYPVWEKGISITKSSLILNNKNGGGWWFSFKNNTKNTLSIKFTAKVFDNEDEIIFEQTNKKSLNFSSGNSSTSSVRTGTNDILLKSGVYKVHFSIYKTDGTHLYDLYLDNVEYTQ